MEKQLERLIELQTEQNTLLKKHLARLKFSLMSLLLLTTVVCVGLGSVIWTQHQRYVAPIPPPVYTGPAVYGTIQTAPAGPPAPSDGDILQVPVQIAFPREQATGNNNAVVQ